ncbi:YceD family protein [Luteolibacter sp. AS25]|uniref:YceD family protein n=1 Tax=Luteolibacter sp. AS25 TaxID=3135776 RepID=UPI00398AEF11
MNSSLIIDLPTLPEEGQAFSGELDGSIFDLSENDATSAGPLEYDLWAQRFESELLLTGTVSAPFTFICVVTLRPFLKTIYLESAAIAVEITKSSQMDVTDALREEILLEFPVNPRCDEGDNPEPCEIDSRYLAVDKAADNDLSPPPRNENDDRWSALNDLPGLKDQP